MGGRPPSEQLGESTRALPGTLEQLSSAMARRGLDPADWINLAPFRAQGRTTISAFGIA